MDKVHQLFQAFVAPAIFVSAEALLVLSVNVRLMGIVSRLRSYLHEKHTAAKQGRFAESEAYAAQIASIERRAEFVRRAFVLTLYSLAGTVLACLLLGAGLYSRLAEPAAAAVFVASVLSLLWGIVYYIREVRMALDSVREEAADSRFMDIHERTQFMEDKGVPRMV